MSTAANMTLYNLEATLMLLMFERETIQKDPDLTPKEIEQALKAKDIEIREHVSKEVKKVDGIAYYLKEFEARAATAKAEKDRQARREKDWEARHDRLEELVKSVMLMSGKSRLDGDANTLKLVKNPPSVEIAQPELVPNSMRRLQVTMSLELYSKIKLALFASEHPAVETLTKELQQCTTTRAEPMKSKIAEALKQTEPCPKCEGVGVLEVYAGHGDKKDVPCELCNKTGKVKRGVPGCVLRSDVLRLEVE